MQAAPPPSLTPMRPEDLIVSPDPSQPRTPDQRMEGFRRMLTDLTFSLGSGLAAASANPRGRSLRTTAGIGQILQVPKFLQDQAEAKRVAEEARRQSAATALSGIMNQQSEIANRAATLKETQRLRTIEEQKAETEKQNIITDNAREADKATLEKNSYAPIGKEVPTKDGIFQLYAPKYWDGQDTSKLVKYKVGDTPDKVDTSQTPFEAWRKENPTAPMSEWFKLNKTEKESDRYNELFAKEQNGTATPAERVELKGLREQKTLTTTTRLEGQAANADVASGRKEVVNAYNDYKDAAQRLKTMTSAAQEAATSKNPGASDMVLLSNHIGMTFGAVKGAKTGRDLIEAHLAAKSLPESLALVAQKVLKGDQLSPEQRSEFLRLGQERLAVVKQSYADAKEVWQYTPPGDKGDIGLESTPHAPAPSPNGTITMTGPDGKIWNVPAGNFGVFEKNGYKRK